MNEIRDFEYAGESYRVLATSLKIAEVFVFITKHLMLQQPEENVSA